MSSHSDPRQPKSTPDIEQPGALPKRFPNNPTPLSKQEDESSPEKPDDTPSTRLGSGEDTSVESGRDKNDPEQQADTDVEKSFE